MATVQDVARHAGVSLGTVSNVLNQPHLVSSEMTARVLAAIEALDYHPKSPLWQQRQKRLEVVGVVVANISNPFFTEVARGVEEAAFEAGYAVHLCNSNFDRQREADHLRILQAQGVSAIVITPLEESLQPLRQLIRLGVGVCVVGRAAATRGVCSVAVDDNEGGYLAAKHLIGLGHRRLLWFCERDAVPRISARELGVIRAIEEAQAAGLPVTWDRLETASTSILVSDATITRALLGDFPYTGIIAGGDLLALGATRAMTRIGIRVPDDVSVIGYDDIDFAAGANVPLTSIRQPMNEFGREALRLATDDRDTGGTHVHQDVVYQPKLIQRASTAPPPAAPASR